MSTTSAPRHWRLSELAAAISDAVNRTFARQDFWVIADVTSHTFKSESNYHYFDLVEKDPVRHNLVARLAAKAWGQGSLSIANFQQATGQRFTNNIEVLVNVSVQFHAVYGLQLNLNAIDPTFTLGKLEQQRLATLDRLVAENPEFIRRTPEGFHTYNRSLILPRVIQRIAVVSSKTSAGWQDFTHTLETNPYQYRFSVTNYFTIVQGEANAGEFVERLVDVFRANIPFDVVVIVRGGGAQTDLLLFDEYLVGKAIAKFPIPVITGIGHQRNETIADQMAHQATKTPTKAAEFIINHNRSFEDAVTALQQRIVIRSQQRFSTSFQRLQGIQQAVVHRSRSLLFDQKHLLYLTKTNLQRSTAALIKNRQATLDHYTTLIRVLSPLNTLKRGFAIIKADGHITTDPDWLHEGKEVEILLKAKKLSATITSKEDYHGEDFNI